LIVDVAEIAGPLVVVFFTTEEKGEDTEGHRGGDYFLFYFHYFELKTGIS
jgi:hypothetical protein